MKRETLRDTTAIVKFMLETEPATRDSDPLLYHRVCEYLNADVLNLPFGFVLKTMQNSNIPPFESVRRSRQKVQRKYPELKGTKKARAKRAKNEQVYRQFARDKDVI
ncbi:MAG: hypothetical protein IKU47_08055 [Oscillospiraceae bacterium]|nr:hypothetical protein [Oscillospiraceae bacterium]